MQTYKIAINSRVDFIFNNTGFDFVVTGKPIFRDWENFKYYWPLYKRDGIVEKIYLFCDRLSDNAKSQTFYQGLKFETI